MAKNDKTAAVTEEEITAETVAAETVAKVEESPMDPMMEPVTITLFKDNDKYNSDVFVAVNGNNYQIQRGVPVTVPRYVAEVINQAEKQRNQAEYFMNEGWKAYKIEQEN